MIMEHFIKGTLNVVVSQQVLEEVVRTIKEKLPDALPALRTLLVSVSLEVVADPSPGELKPWVDKLSEADAAIFVAALQAKPDYFITGDNHFLGNSSLAETGLNIVNPAQFLKVF